MGVLSWFSSTANKSKAAAIIQQAFEFQKRVGLLDEDPAALANRVVEMACTRIPKLDAQYADHMLAVACLSVALTDTQASKEIQLVYRETLRRFHIALMQAIEAGRIQLNEAQRDFFERSLAVVATLDKKNSNIRLNESEQSTGFEDAAVDVAKFARVTGKGAILIEADSSLESAAMEFEFISSSLKESQGWSILSQSMVQEDQFVYDKAEVLLANGSTKTFWFDITDSWHRWSSNA